VVLQKQLQSLLPTQQAGDRGVVDAQAGENIITGDHNRVVKTTTYIEQQTVLPPDLPGPDQDALRTAYLHYVFETCRPLSLAGIDPKTASNEAEARLNLAEIYTALLTLSLRQYEHLQRGEPSEAQERLSALTHLNNQRRLVLLGDAGSGKSTFVSFVALCLAGEALGQADANLKTLTAPLPDEKGKDQPERQPWQHPPLLVG
jgi:DNA replication protein DnaC